MAVDLVSAALSAAGDLFGPWGVLVFAGTPSAAAAGGVMWLRWRDQRLKEREKTLTADELEALRIERERQQLSAGQQQLFGNLTSEITRLGEALRQAHASGDRGWAFARRCETRMHQLYHLLLNTRQIVDGDRERAKLDPVAWPAIEPLPTEEDIA